MELVKTVDVSCKLSKEIYQLNWTVEGFNLIPLVRDHPIFGPSIQLGKEVDSTWQLLMAKQRSEEDKIPSLGFKLVKTEENTVWDVCRYDITVMDESGERKLKVADNALAGGEEDLPYKFAKGVEEDVFTNEDGKQQPDDDSPVRDRKKTNVVSPESKTLQSLFSEKVVKVVCDIRYVYMTDSPDEPADTPEERLLIHDLRQLYKSQKFSDVVLVAENKEFLAHKSLLCARAEGFDSLLQEDELPNKQKLHLHVPAPVGELLLSYLYGCEFAENLGASEYYDLYKVSVRFTINRLKERCAKILKEMAKDEPSCKDCATLEETFEKLVESTKMEVETVEGKQEADVALEPASIADVPETADDAPSSTPEKGQSDAVADKEKSC